MSPVAPKPQRMRPLEPAVVAFGSNLGDREATIRAALDDLASTPGVRLDAVSSLHETAALRLDGVDQDAPRYLNGIALISAALDPHALLDELHRIEDANGRVRVERWGDRTLDLDLIAMGGRYVDDETLVLPHPRAAEREFVLAPWLDVDPDAELPGLGRVDVLLERVRASASADSGTGPGAGAEAVGRSSDAEPDGSGEGSRS
ncbi:2-amino-4-hydroxy-6-hydroxymethyldihydropteridine diphosphokinase [Planctomonas sp. JC2975]|uniref:2-amino-4-hydroxy-6- hydroxymethyldihydropteridine diphosphokinase n=1 Tax=Planctomonas sp. JC2975 TaxID=2729626 RepID=UPI00147414C8|nr:2-amino-4-hydroxy-6-hydroxymethyldihydropteridine diphosphokinase [Planctomonas sp. JC2975]NNC12072.1 2-amino-4-hydroxy-6-hydroxymethyldihydropteridine diphosphokinase [Planctomonas sp. JC2975]